MNNKTKTWIITGVAAVAIIGGGGYYFTNSYLGNNVEIEQVLPASTAASAKATDSGSTAKVENKTAGAEKLSGDWNISQGSKVYFSVTTSQETVNFVDEQVSGKWSLNDQDPAKSTAEGQIEMSGIDSGNSQRDEHVKSADFFDMAQYPQATFKATSFEGMPAEWTEGQTVDVKMKGTLTVKGIEKPVTFDAKAAYQNNQVLLSGTTKVTFEDFGMKNPHSVVLSTENDIQVRLELKLAK
ncbi:YceI family protein [Paenibacillus barcinonensis]|uniref:YceI family protein n=1 Tax=Paenibacillus barcinonensis TaxID=198119 RepID=A0A2V4WGH6_PAEBA|nr:YceI family protein [Paenibacillus barcinonensis]PYE51240.1 YceI-like domain-containing protein [Paenibacillus barcinonensis]QKS55645.1 YceI family protein [Paenibacillus barcinonensis]